MSTEQDVVDAAKRLKLAYMARNHAAATKARAWTELQDAEPHRTTERETYNVAMRVARDADVEYTECEHDLVTSALQLYDETIIVDVEATSL